MNKFLLCVNLAVAGLIFSSNVSADVQSWEEGAWEFPTVAGTSRILEGVPVIHSSAEAYLNPANQNEINTVRERCEKAVQNARQLAVSRGLNLVDTKHCWRDSHVISTNDALQLVRYIGDVYFTPKN